MEKENAMVKKKRHESGINKTEIGIYTYFLKAKSTISDDNKHINTGKQRRGGEKTVL